MAVTGSLVPGFPPCWVEVIAVCSCEVLCFTNPLKIQGKECCLTAVFTSVSWAEWAEQLTQMGRGKHFIGDFLPPDELEKFMETFKALKVK